MQCLVADIESPSNLWRAKGYANGRITLGRKENRYAPLHTVWVKPETLSCLTFIGDHTLVIGQVTGQVVFHEWSNSSTISRIYQASHGPITAIVTDAQTAIVFCATRSPQIWKVAHGNESFSHSLESMSINPRCCLLIGGEWLFDAPDRDGSSEVRQWKVFPKGELVHSVTTSLKGIVRLRHHLPSIHPICIEAVSEHEEVVEVGFETRCNLSCDDR
jgi:hypothetical protein